MREKINHIIGCKTNLSKFNKTEIIQIDFSGHNCVKLDIDNSRDLENPRICENRATQFWTTSGSYKKSKINLKIITKQVKVKIKYINS